MGLTGGWRDNVNGWSMALTLFLWFFVVSFIYAIFALGVRGVAFYSPIPGLEVAPMLATGLGFLVASLMGLNITGGYVFHMHMTMTLLVGSVMNRLYSSKKNEKMYKHADPNWKDLDLARFGLATIGMFLGFFAAPLFVWFFVGSFAVFVPHSPGTFPGFNPVGFEPWRAFAAEAVVTGVLGVMLTYFALTGYDPEEMDQKRANAKYKKGLRYTAIAVAASIGLVWNISGGCFDLALWVAEHLMVSIVLGQMPFVTAPFDDISKYWFVYVLGNAVGWFVGVLIGYLVAGADVGMYDDEEETPEEKQPLNKKAGIEMSASRRQGNRSVGNNSQPTKRTADQVDQLAIAGGLFDRHDE